MKLLFCSCRGCKRGKHSRRFRGIIKSFVRKGRQTTRLMIKHGKYDDIPEKISAGYTD